MLSTYFKCILLLLLNLLINCNIFGQTHQDFNNGNLTGVNVLEINDPGSGQGLRFGQTSAGWNIDVSPEDRSNNDGNLNLYGTANKVISWRPLEVRSQNDYTGSILELSSKKEPGKYRLDISAGSLSGVVRYRFNLTNYNIVYENNLVLDRGKVGIGTEAPATILDIFGEGSNATIRINTPANGTKKDSWIYHAVGGELKSALGYRHTTDALSLYHYGEDRLIIKNDGNVGIGTLNTESKLTVDGTITSEEIKIKQVQGADFVFEEDYELPTLESIEKYVKENKHLPDIPSAHEMQQEGIKLGEMNILLLQKIEELTLHLIEQEKRAKVQEGKINLLEKELKQIKEAQSAKKE